MVCEEEEIMRWHGRLKQWLDYGCPRDMRVGERDLKWINSFRRDLERWGFPIELYWENPVMGKRRVEVFLRKLNGGSRE